jgi:NAD(P)-dependent dehydrogenase (short-subunit alcohol dehydrogenase family)
MTERLDGRSILVTGANGGLGVEFVRQGLARGARRIYAAARTPGHWDDERVVALALDLTDPVSISTATDMAVDVDLLVNNAAIAPVEDHSVLGGDEDVLRRIFETNFIGTLRVTKSFAPVLAANGGGAVLNVLSAAAWLPVPTVYAASKAAAWSITNALRVELAPQGTTVTALLMGMVDTAMSARWDLPKVSPQSVVEQAYDGVATGAFEVLADEDTRYVKSLMADSAEKLFATLSERLSGFEP